MAAETAAETDAPGVDVPPNSLAMVASGRDALVTNWRRTDRVL